MKRSAFTLLELLIVISIISLLIALLAPALMGVTVRAKEAASFGEIQGLANACDSFKAQYHVYPPSKIVLFEKGGNSSSPAPGTWFPPVGDPQFTNAAESRSMIRRIFGTEFDFSIDRDINNNGTRTDVLTLNGSECLVFFLGGPTRKVGGKFECLGLSLSKRDPFETASSSRLKFFTAFDAVRLIDSNGNWCPEYVSSYQSELRSPLLYFSTTRTSQYQSSDCPSTMTDIYRSGPSTPYKQDAFQIVSSGYDCEYGTGGPYSRDTANSQLIGSRISERDNITNFSGGRLAD